MEILAQCFTICSKVIESLGLLCKNKLKMYIMIAVASIGYTTCYVLLGSAIGATANMVQMFRNFAYPYVEKHNPTKTKYAFLIAFQIVVISVVLIIFFNSAWDLCILVSVLILSVGQAYKNPLVNRIIILVNCLLWLSYNLMFGAYINMCLDCISTIAISISICRYHLIPYVKMKKNNKSNV